MTVKSAFFAYPAQPADLGATISRGVESFRASGGPVDLLTWQEDHVAGHFIASRVLEQIGRHDVLVADITLLNFNVLYEIGFAMGKGKRLLLLRNASFREGVPTVSDLGVVDTLGYASYENAKDVERLLREFDSAPVAQPLPPLNRNAPLFLTQARFKTDTVTRIVSRVKKARLFFRNFDPAESPRLSGPDAFRQVAESFGVLLHLLPAHIADSALNNLRVAFLAGVAAGLGKSTLLLQEQWDPVPQDCRDLVTSFRHPSEIDEAIAGFVEDVTEELQTALADSSAVPRSALEAVSFFSSAAENELRNLSGYYLPTDAFQRALRGEVRLVVGRKGSGKTAVFAQVRDAVRQQRQNVVLDLMPEGYKLRKFKETILAAMGEGTQEHVLTAFWEYLLFLEICHKLLEKDRQAHTYDRRLVEPYQRLSHLYEGDEYVAEGDFSERMTSLLNRIADDHRASSDDAAAVLSPERVTQLLYRHDVPALRDAVCEYLSFKNEVRLLFDNLDKGWPSHGLEASDLKIIRSLLEATRKLEQHLQKRGVVCRTLVFLRNDVYERLVDETPDRGKDARVGLDWTDPDMLRELVRRRLVYSGMGEASFDQLWRQVFVSHVNGEESSQYLIERCLMRPRGLIDLLNHCKSFAVNLRHEKVTAADIEKGLRAFSNDLVADVGYEIRDVMPTAGDAIYAFIDSPGRLLEEEVAIALRAAGIQDGSREAVIDLLLWYGVMGLAGTEGQDAIYIYSVNYEMPLLRTRIAKDRRENSRVTYQLNPAFLPALSIRG